jgi:hypothetical protein
MRWTFGDSGKGGNQKIDGLAFDDDLLYEIYRQIPGWLSEQYSSLQGKPAWSSTIPRESWMAEYDRRKMAMMFEALRKCNNVPFTEWCVVSPL